MKTQIIGILNVTPDSFSDGGLYLDKNKAIRKAESLIEDGADIIDIGAQSTRPGAALVTHEEEWERLEPCLKIVIELALRNRRKISIDTIHPENAERAIDLGAHIINDVSGLTNRKMRRILKANQQAQCIFMHNLGIPASKKKVVPEAQNITGVVIGTARKTLYACIEDGVKKNQLIYDPGLGFGKTSKQSLEIIKNFMKVKELNLPICVGHSRKSFLELIINDYNKNDIEALDEATANISKLLMKQGADYLRVHKVKF